MKQEIFCPNCYQELKKIIGKGHKGEFVKFTPGRALRPYVCDFGGEPIDAMTRCIAFSVWTVDRPYLEGWEEDYILPGGEE